MKRGCPVHVLYKQERFAKPLCLAYELFPRGALIPGEGNWIFSVYTMTVITPTDFEGDI